MELRLSISDDGGILAIDAGNYLRLHLGTLNATTCPYLLSCSRQGDYFWGHSFLKLECPFFELTIDVGVFPCIGMSTPSKPFLEWELNRL